MHTTPGRQADREATFRAAAIFLPAVPLVLSRVVVPPELTLPWVGASLLVGVVAGSLIATLDVPVEAVLGRPLPAMGDLTPLTKVAVVLATAGGIVALLALVIAVAISTSPAVVDGMVLAAAGLNLGAALTVLGRSVVWPRLATPG